MIIVLLYDLISYDAFLICWVGQYNRRNSDSSSRMIEFQNIICPPFHFDIGHMIAAGAGLLMKRHSVGDFIADEGLSEVGKIGDEEFIRRSPRRNRLIILIYRLYDYPVCKQMEMTMFAGSGDETCF